MTTPVPRSVVQAFLQAFAERDTAKLVPLLHDDVSWSVVGPIELLSFCGERHGKAEVVDLIDRVGPATYRVTRFEPEMLLVDADRCAMLGRIGGMTEDGRSISYHYSVFVRFVEEKVAEYRSIIDSFDAAEQVLGHQILLSADRAAASFARGNLIAV